MMLIMFDRLMDDMKKEYERKMEEKMKEQKKHHMEEMGALRSRMDQKRSQELKELKKNMEERSKIPTIEEQVIKEDITGTLEEVQNP